MSRPQDSPRNDYSGLEERYRAAVGHELVRDPLESLRHRPPLTLSASIVIPAWNTGETIARCVSAIAKSSFNRRYSDRLEVVVVDDGSTDGTWEILQRFEPDVRIKAIRKEHGHSRAQAMNTGFAFAEGDVFICCDADMLLGPLTIEELIKRHQVIGSALLLGFRAHIGNGDPRITLEAVNSEVPLSPPLLSGDERFQIGTAWPEHVCRDSDHLKRLGGDRAIIASYGHQWTLVHNVFGHHFSMLRSDWRAVDGYDERFIGWGYEDTLVGARAEALGIPLIPVYSSLGWHVAHPPRSEKKDEEAEATRRVFTEARWEPFAPRHGETIDRAAGRALEAFERQRGSATSRHAVTDEAALAPYVERFASPMNRGDYFHSLGRYDEAALAYATAWDANGDAAAVVNQVRSYRLAGRLEEALSLLMDPPVSLDGNGEAIRELVLVRAGRGEIAEARASLDRARQVDPLDPTLAYILQHDEHHHRRRGDFYARQGDHKLSVRDYQAALLVEPIAPPIPAAREGVKARGRRLLRWRPRLLQIAGGGTGSTATPSQGASYRETDLSGMVVLDPHRLNDYAAVEAAYLAATGHELVRDPLHSMRHHPPLTLTASVVIPAYKAGATIERCVAAIAMSSFNRRYPDRLEVIVVDDGSPDGTWEMLQRLQPGVRLKAIRKEHGHSRSQTRNTGFAFAEGDVVICCDADMLLGHFAIEELVKRHQVVERVLLLGFQSNIKADDPRIEADAINAGTPLSPPMLSGDGRFYVGGTWPEHVCRDSDHLKRLGGDRVIVTSHGNRWTLANTVGGHHFSMRRSEWREIDGYDERFFGWGYEDSLIGVRAETLGMPVIPVYSAVGWHVAHPPRSDRQGEEAAETGRLFGDAKREAFTPRDGETIDRAARRALEVLERPHGDTPRQAPSDDQAIAPYDERYAAPMDFGGYMSNLGRYDEATLAYAEVSGSDELMALAAVNRAQSLRLAGRLDDALSFLVDPPVSLDGRADALRETALVLAGQGEVGRAREYLDRAQNVNPLDPAVAYIVKHDAKHHRRRGNIYLRQGDYALAIRDFEAALLVDPESRIAWSARARARAAMGPAVDGPLSAHVVEGTNPSSPKERAVSSVEMTTNGPVELDPLRLNDYSALEAGYRAAFGHELVRDPHDSMRFHPPLTLSVSVVVPSWKAGSTLERCLDAIAVSSFNRRYPERLEVIVTDDGSTDGTWELLQRVDPGVRLKAIRKEHGHSKGQTQNTGFAFAEGDVLIQCDSDIFLMPLAIEEFVKRHEFLEHGLLLGFQVVIPGDDPRIGTEAIAAGTPLSPPLFHGDGRFHAGAAWPESVCRDTNHLQRLGGERRLVTSHGNSWTLAHNVGGNVFSMRRSDWRAMDGYDERFTGWGYEDTLVGVRAQQLGMPIIPVYSALGWHVAHPARSGDQIGYEAGENGRRYGEYKQEPFGPRNGETIDRAASRALEVSERPAGSGPRSVVTDEAAIAAYDERYADPMGYGDYLQALGRYGEAERAYAEVPASDGRAVWAVVNRAQSMRLTGRAESALSLLRDPPVAIDGNSAALREMALAFAARGAIVEARHWVERARRMPHRDPTIEYIVGHDGTHHRARGDVYANQDDHELAVRDYEAALVMDAHDLAAWSARSRSRSARGRSSGWSDVRPLPLTSRIVAAGQAIPGTLTPGEAEVLVALVQGLVARRDPGDHVLLAELDPGLGRATVTMGLTLRGMDRDNAQLIAVMGPDIEPGPDGLWPSDILREGLEAHQLGEIVRIVPIEESEMPGWGYQLVLVNGSRDETGVRDKVARFARSLVDGGLLVILDCRAEFPGVQAVVDELLVDSGYRLVVREQALVALTTIASTPVLPNEEGVTPWGLR